MSDLENEFIRRTSALQAIVNEHNDENGRGGIAKVAKKLEVEPSYLQRCLYPPGKAGRKRIGDAMVIKLSKCFPEWIGQPTQAEEQTKVKPLPKRYPKEIEAVIKLMLETDDIGRGMALGAVTIALHSHKPIRKHRAS